MNHQPNEIARSLSTGKKMTIGVIVTDISKVDSFAIANIPIIYIGQALKKMGEKAVDVLMEQIKGSDTIKQCVFDTELMYMN